MVVLFHPAVVGASPCPPRNSGRYFAMNKHLLITVSAIVAVGCSKSPFPSNTARINDVAVRQANDTGYRVASVDGRKPTRASSDYVTVVPLILVSPGAHTLGLKSENAGYPQLTISATVAAGKEYRIAPAGKGNVALVEDRN
jgi:hypothetical protein